MNEQQDLTWLEQEQAELNSFVGEKLPYMKFEENKVIEIEIDFSKPFQKWHNTNIKGEEVTKAIVPVTHAGTKKNWWLNIRNPIYKDVIHAGAAGQNKIKILQTGTQANTKYVLVN